MNINNNFAILETLEILGLNQYAFEYEFIEKSELCGIEIIRQGNNIKIIYSEKAFLFRALGLLKERVEEQNFNLKENANFTMNGIMLDCSRGLVANIETVKKMVRHLSLMGHNTLMLYTEDTYEVEGHPYFGYFRGRYTVEELKEIDDYAFEYGVEVVPCIQTLGHLGHVTKYFNTYGHITDSAGILLIDEPETYEFVDKMIETCRKAFRSKRVHIGMDETHFMGRGKYYDKHGFTDHQMLFLKHLKRVNDICVKYDFRPMMWGDMPLRIAGCSGYTDCDFSLKDLSPLYRMPDYVDFIYWDYYSKTPERYDEFVKVHKSVSEHVIFAGGAWRWLNLAPNLIHSIKVSKMALEKCIENDIKEVFVTMWGDDGNEQSLFTCWPVLQLYAEYGFRNSVDDEYLAKRLKTCTGMNLDDFYLLDKLNRVPNAEENIMAENPPKYLYYQDIMMGLYDYYVKDGYNAFYANCAAELKAVADRGGEFAYVFETSAALSSVLEDKAELGIKITDAYKTGNHDALQEIAKNVIPCVIEKVQKYHDCFERQWNIEGKIFGFQTMDIRFGAMIQRLTSAKNRIEKYLSGEILSLPELEEERLPYDSHTETSVLSANWGGIVTSC